MKNTLQTPNLDFQQLKNFTLILTFFLSNTLPVLANNSNLPPKIENSTIEPNSEKCNFPTKNENVYDMYGIARIIYDLGQKNIEEYNQRSLMISERSENLVFFVNTECSQEINQRMLEMIKNDPFVQSAIDQKLFTNTVYFYIGDTGRADFMQIVYSGITYIKINPRVLTQPTFSMMHNDLLEPVIQLFLLKEGKSVEEVDQFNMDIKIHTWAISSFIGDPRDFIGNPKDFPIGYSLVKTLMAMYGKENYLKMSASQKLFLMQQLLDTLSPQSIANILNERLWWLIEDEHYQKNGQGFVGSHDRKKAQKYVDEVNRVFEKVIVGVSISKHVKLVIKESILDGKIFWKAEFVAKTEADTLPKAWRPDLIGKIKIADVTQKTKS